MPGKLLYLFQLEIDDPDAFWINEIWESKAAYDACLTLPQVGDWSGRAGCADGRDRASATETIPLEH